MKKILSILIVGVILLGGLGAIALPSEKGKEEKMTISFSQLTMNEKDNCIILELENTNSVLMRKDYYMVPTLIETFTFPFGTEILDVQCIPKNIQKQVLTKELMIAPEPVIAGQIFINENPQRIENPISIDTWYEYDVGCGIDNNERYIYVKVQTFPIQYNPLENTIELAKNIEIAIEYEEQEQQPMVFNDEEYVFIILTPSEFSDELGNLLDHKNSRNISTKLVTLDEIYSGNYFPVQGRDNPEKIKYFIKNAVENWGTNNVVLVGGKQKFPVRETHIHATSKDSEIFVSDLYYADIYDDKFNFSNWDTNENDIFGEYDWSSSHDTDDVDLYPDVYLGRLACVNDDEVTTCVNKIITYEETQAYTQDWFSNIVVIGGDSFPEDDDEISEGEYVNDAVINIMDGFLSERLWASNGKLDSINPSGGSIITNSIDKGCGFIDFSGHGNTNIWATHPYNDHNKWLPTPLGGYLNTNIKKTLNGDKLPIIVTGACSVGKYNKDYDCFSWSFVSNPYGGGIGSFGATGLGWAYTGKWVTQGLIEKMSLNIFEAYKEQHAITFGELWVRAITNYISTDMEGTDYKTIEEWQCFGDPTLAIASQSLSPEKPNAPHGSTSVRINTEYAYNVSTVDPEEDQIYYLFDWGDGEPSGWLGPYASGERAETVHKWVKKGSYQIRVKAKDEHGAMSDWSDPLPISVPKNKHLINSLFFNFFERFPQLFPIIRTLIEYLPPNEF